LRDSLDLIVETGDRPVVGRVSGGGAESDLWLSIVAAVLDLPLQRTAVSAGAAYGAALLGGVAGGVFTNVEEAVDRCVRVGDVIEPDPDLVDLYREQRAAFTALYPTLRGLQDRGA
jgi:xylulokinase